MGKKYHDCKEEILGADGGSSLFIDIDGTLFKHHTDENGVGVDDQVFRPVEVLEGVREKFAEWRNRGCYIVLTTARKEEYREITEKQLKSACLHWDQLVMGVKSGERYIINDLKPYKPHKPMAVAINITRNSGLRNVDLELANEIQTLALFYGVGSDIIQ